MKLYEIKQIIDELVGEELLLKTEGGVGYVNDKDMKKDPKHIKGERWRIKFQSSKDLKKHGNTEKSPVSEEREESIKKNEMWIGWEDQQESRNNSTKNKNMNENRKLLKTIIREAIKEVQDEDYEWQEQQEKLSMKRIQSYAHWGKANLTKHPDEIPKIFDNIIKEIDGLVKAHDEGKEVSTVNISQSTDKTPQISEVAPPGWEGTVKSMKKHSIGGAKRWNPKKKDESVEDESNLEEKEKKITNPYALAWWMKNQGYTPHHKK